jgi:ATP-dependent Lon protease
MIEKLRNCFDEMVVYKDLKKNNFLSSLGLPSFMRDWLLKKFEDDNGEFDTDELVRFVKQFLPNKEDWISIKDRVVMGNERIRFLAKITIDIDIKTREVSFSLPDFGLTSKDTVIEEDVWDSCREDLVHTRETWGMVEIGYRQPDDYDIEFLRNKAKGANHGKIKLIGFKAFCPYTIDLEYFKDMRREFSLAEWLDVLLGAVDYNAAGYVDEDKNGDRIVDSIERKLTMLTRLLPFVEKRLHLIELAPKGTGKSYLFGQVSRFGWLSGGGTMSRAKLFYDQSRRTEGIISGNDFVALDEVQTISFSDVDEMRAALKTYMMSDSGTFTVGNYEGNADAGIVLCGNIKKETMDADGFSNMFEELPAVFHESALIERFHGFIKGWNIPRMNEDLKISGWALNSEYFCAIMHELRSDSTYRAVVDKLIEIPEAADTRDTEAIKRITTAYLKLLFPHVREASDIRFSDFRLCLDRARKMRDTIKYQLGILDSEYRGKDIPVFTVQEVY